MLLFYIGIGTATGAVIRMLATMQLNSTFKRQKFPWATFVINMTACLLIGIFSTHFHSAPLKALLISGMLGGLSTFSTFSNEFVTLFKDSTTKKLAINYLIASLIIGIGLVSLGTII
ncbi:CrcB family protein [Pediococcus stilesii]|uniref:Fluoride-specific ion channel FluC n=1 Tax=Pediococcus stilesii TaxID=331679 RepID=A0A5R9BW05_9LACO|nr:CrcB family protein [Pediococcus stilesii]TLQ04181.1 CrcB family protein [Pediococcus stilesii]